MLVVVVVVALWMDYRMGYRMWASCIEGMGSGLVRHCGWGGRAVVLPFVEAAVHRTPGPGAR
jgi:hypothetical protein